MTDKTPAVRPPRGPRHLYAIAAAARREATAPEGDWIPVAVYPATNLGGCNVLISASRSDQDRFFRIECPEQGIDLLAGTDSHEFVHELARCLANGMLQKTRQPQQIKEGRR